jgi:hypothetical protein
MSRRFNPLIECFCEIVVGACRKSNPDILVVQPAENWAAKYVPGPLDGTQDRRILLQG